MVATGRNIKSYRVARNITIEELAEICLVSPQAICKWQKGKALPTMDNLFILTDVFMVKAEDLIVRDDDRSSVVSGVITRFRNLRYCRYIL